MKLISWNVNSVRTRIEHIKRLVENVNPDVICLQETKVENSSFPLKPFEQMGFRFFAINGMKSHNGVCIISKLQIKNEEKYSFCKKQDSRHISATINGIEVHNLYVPAGGDEPNVQSNPKFKHKIYFLDELVEVYKNRKKNLLLCGDFNVAPLEDDVWSHKQLIHTVSHTEVERKKLLNFMNLGSWTDIVREKINPPSNIFTWWSYRSPDYTKNNKGRRLDHILCSKNLTKRIFTVKIHEQTRAWSRPSDHVPIEIIIET